MLRKFLVLGVLASLSACSAGVGDSIEEDSLAVSSGASDFRLQGEDSGCASRGEVSVPLDASTRADSPGAAYLLMWASNLAYSEPDHIDRVARQAGFTRVTHVNHRWRSGLQAFVASRPGLRVLAFRGTQGGQDIVADLADFTRPGAEIGLPGKVHAGMRYYVEAGWGDVLKALAEAGPGTDPIWVTGHSLGGGLATLFGARLASEEHPVRAVVPFAAPRSGDTEYARGVEAILGERYVRVVLEDDPVPKTPASPEGADPFVRASALTGQWAELRRRQLAGLRYAHAGLPRRLDVVSGALATTPDWKDAADVVFYEAIYAKILGPNGVIDKTLRDKVWGKAFESHAAGAYACALGEALATP